MTAATAAQHQLLREDRAFAAFLAALSQAGMPRISGKASDVHASFAEALRVLQGDPYLGPLFEGFYPSRSTGYIEELDKALIRGEVSGFVHYANPTYSNITVSLSPREIWELLDEFHSSREALERAAGVFQKSLSNVAW